MVTMTDRGSLRQVKFLNPVAIYGRVQPPNLERQFFESASAIAKGQNATSHKKVYTSPWACSLLHGKRDTFRKEEKEKSILAGLGKIKCRPNDEQRRFAGEYLEGSTVAECKSIEIAVKGQNANDRMKDSSLQICSVLVNTITVKEAKAESGKENVNATTATAMTAKNDLQLPIEVAIGCGHMHCWILSVLSVIWTFARKRGVAVCPGMQSKHEHRNGRSTHESKAGATWKGSRRASDRRRRARRVAAAVRQNRARTNSLILILLLGVASVSEFIQDTGGFSMEESDEPLAATPKIHGNRTEYEMRTVLRQMQRLRRKNARMQERLSEADAKLKEGKCAKTSAASSGKDGHNREIGLVEKQHLTHLLEKRAEEISMLMQEKIAMSLQLQIYKEKETNTRDSNNDVDLDKKKGILRHYHQHQLLSSKKATATENEKHLPFVNITQGLIDTHLSEADHAMLNNLPTPHQQRRRLAACPTFTADGSWVIITQNCAMSGVVTLESGQTLKVKSSGGTRWNITAATSSRHFFVNSGGELNLEGIALTGGKAVCN